MRALHVLGLVLGPLAVFAAAAAAQDAPRPAAPKATAPQVRVAPLVPGKPISPRLLIGESDGAVVTRSAEAVRMPMVVQHVDTSLYPIVVAHGDPARFPIRNATPPAAGQTVRLTPRIDPRLMPAYAPMKP